MLSNGLWWEIFGVLVLVESHGEGALLSVQYLAWNLFI